MATTGERPPLVLTISDEAFDPQATAAATTALEEAFEVGGPAAEQAPGLPAPDVVVELALPALRALPGDRFGEGLFAGLRHLLRPRYADETHFGLKVDEATGERWIEGYLTTGSEDELRGALGAFRDVALGSPPGDVLQYDPEERRWQKRR